MRWTHDALDLDLRRSYYMHHARNKRCSCFGDVWLEQVCMRSLALSLARYRCARAHLALEKRGLPHERHVQVRALVGDGVHLRTPARLGERTVRRASTPRRHSPHLAVCLGHQHLLPTHVHNLHALASVSACQDFQQTHMCVTSTQELALACLSGARLHREAKRGPGVACKRWSSVKLENKQ